MDRWMARWMDGWTSTQALAYDYYYYYYGKRTVSELVKSGFLVPSIYLLFVVRPMELNGRGKYTTQTVMNVGFRPSSATLHLQSYGEFVVCQVERGHKWVNLINSWN